MVNTTSQDGHYETGVFQIFLGQEREMVPAVATAECSVLGDAAVFVSLFTPATSDCCNWTGPEFGLGLRYDRARGIVEELAGDSAALSLTGKTFEPSDSLVDAVAAGAAGEALREMLRTTNWIVASGSHEAFAHVREEPEFVPMAARRGFEAV